MSVALEVAEPAMGAAATTTAEIAPTKAIRGDDLPPSTVPESGLTEGGSAADTPSRGSSLSAADGISCDRPGCYDLFCPTARSPQQRFCTKSCRCAMERVWQRERRWRARHGVGPPRARAGMPAH